MERRELPTPARFAIGASWPVAAMLAAVSLGGLLVPAAYAREAPAWVEQAIGQDWFDLVIAAPWIAVCGYFARRGSYRWSVLLAGAYAYVVYEMFIYAFAIHFNAFFLLYCATLGLAGYALVAEIMFLHRRIEPVDRRGARIGGAFLVTLGSAFAAMWLAEDIPAMLRNEPSPTLAETGLFTNPVHVIDLAFVLPAHVVAGVLLWRGRPSGFLFGAIVLAFGVPMAASIGGMMLVIQLVGGAAAPAVTVAMLVVAAITAAVLARVLRGERAATAAPSRSAPAPTARRSAAGSAPA